MHLSFFSAKGKSWIAWDQQLLHSGGEHQAISIKWQFADIEQPVILSGTNYSKYKVQRNPNIVMWLLLRAVAQLNAFHPGSLAFNHNNKHCHIKCYQIEIMQIHLPCYIS